MNQDVLLKRRIIGREAIVLWKIYNDTFNRLIGKTAQEQKCFNKKTFLKALRNSKYLKFIVYDFGAPIGFTLITKHLNLARVTYMRPERFEELAGPHRKGKIYYVTCAAVKKEYERQGVSFALFTRAIEYAYNRGGIGAFDYAIESTPQWQQIGEKIINYLSSNNRLNQEGIKYQIVGRQEYAILG